MSFKGVVSSISLFLFELDATYKEDKSKFQVHYGKAGGVQDRTQAAEGMGMVTLRSGRLAFFCFGFAFCSMFTFMVMTRLIGEWSGDLALWSAVSSACYMGLMGLGILQADRSRLEDAYLRVGTVELGLALLGPLLVYGLYLWHMLYRIYFYEQGILVAMGESPRIVLFASCAQIAIMVLGYLAGLEVGLVNRLAYQQGLRQVQRLLAIYHLGGLLASLALLLVLAPRFEWLSLALGCGVLHLVIAGLWLWRFEARAKRRRLLAASVTLLGALIFHVYDSQVIQVQLKNFYYNRFAWEMNGRGVLNFFHPMGLFAFWQRSAGLPAIERYKGPYQSIDIVPELDRDLHGLRSRLDQAPDSEPLEPVSRSAWTLYMDGHFQLHSEAEASYHQTMAHVPSALRGSSRGQLLVVGGGDGLLARELLRGARTLPGSKDFGVTLIDIDPEILELARTHPRLLTLNKGALLDPEVKLIEGDALQTLRRHGETFDAIYMDVLYPFNMESSRLYSLEFFAILAKRLRPGGTLSLLSPIDFASRDQPDQLPQIRWLSSTLHAAGFRQLIIFAEKRHSFVLARREPLPIAAWPYLNQSPWAPLLDDPSSLQQVAELPLLSEPKWVNSLLRPRFVGIKDPFF